MMTRISAAIALLLALNAALAHPAIAGQAPPDSPHPASEPCEYVELCDVDQRYEKVHSLPSSITHYSCDEHGQAPAGAINETADLQAWIDSVPDGGGNAGDGSTGLPSVNNWHVLDFPDARCIRIDGQLTVEDRNHLIFKGDGVTLDQHLKPARDNTSERITWFVWRGSFLKWEAFKIVGNHSEKVRHPADSSVLTKVSTYGHCHDGSGTCEWQAAWRFLGTWHAWLERNRTENTHGDSVEIGWDLPNQPPNARDARYIAITNHGVFGTGRQGISAVSGQDVMIRNSYLEGAAQVGIDIEPEQPVFPVRRWTISNNQFGQSYAAIAQLGGANTCTDVSDINFSDNQQLEPNITSWPAISAARPSGCSAQRGPLNITNNSFWIEEWWHDGDSLAELSGYSDVTFASNASKLSCYPGTKCQGDQTPLSLGGGQGHAVTRNNLAVAGWQPWSSVYRYGSMVHGSLGSSVSSCGNAILRLTDQPVPCSPLPP